MIRSIIFDFGGVINKIGNLRFVLDKIKQNSDAEIEERIKYCGEAFNKSHLYEVDDLFDAIRGFYGTTLNNTEICKLAVEPNLEVIDLVKKLSKNYKLTMLTSIHKGLINEFMKQEDISSYFNNIVETCKIHKSKKDIEAYKITLDLIGEEAEKVIFIDDGQKNLDLAESLGIKTILYTGISDLENKLKDYGVNAT